MSGPVERTIPALSPGVELIDSHCHLDEKRFDDDRAEMLTRAEAAAVRQMVTIGASSGMQTNHAAVELATRLPQVFATVGIHPHDARLVDDGIMQELEHMATSPKVVGIGETGLDYYYGHSPREQQLDAFRRFLDLARRRQLPCIIHLRDAYEDAVEVMRSERAWEIGGVIHCFSGDRSNARDFLDLGFDLSFSGILTFKNADELRAVAAEVPADRFHVETDAPYLAPVPFRGKRNEPAFVTCTAAAIATIRGQSLDEVATQATANTRRLFRLPDAASPT